MGSSMSETSHLCCKTAMVKVGSYTLTLHCVPGPVMSAYELWSCNCCSSIKAFLKRS
jgi:hypothetical protein